MHVGTQVTSVSASGDDGNIPENTLDNNLNTRWSNFGLGSSIEYTFSEPQLVCNVDISWYRGNERVNDFSIFSFRRWNQLQECI